MTVNNLPIPCTAHGRAGQAEDVPVAHRDAREWAHSLDRGGAVAVAHHQKQRGEAQSRRFSKQRLERNRGELRGR